MIKKIITILLLSLTTLSYGQQLTAHAWLVADSDGKILEGILIAFCDISS